MNRLKQPLSAKLGEVKFRQKLIKQHQGKKVFYPTHTTASENLALLKERSENTLKIFKELKRERISFSPFLELGGEKCERAAILTSKMNCQGMAVDLSAESLKSAAKFCPQIGLKKLPLRICADAYHLPFADHSLPFVFTFQTLHHFPDPKPILREIYRVLAPGGYFYFAEEPIKQAFNFSLWRRDYHLRWWEKILKAIFILPFISTIGKSEVSAGILEETFAFSTWEKALNEFDEAQVEFIPFPFGPKSKIKKQNQKGWLKPKLLTRMIIRFSGGGLNALCRKKGKLKSPPAVLLRPLFTCPGCQKKLIKEKNYFQCVFCKQKYPVKNSLVYLLKPALRKKLYPCL